MQVGQKAGVLSQIDGKLDWGTIVYVEHDYEYDLDWVYLKSDFDELNTEVDPKFQGKFWCVIGSTSPLLEVEED